MFKITIMHPWSGRDVVYSFFLSGVHFCLVPHDLVSSPKAQQGPQDLFPTPLATLILFFTMLYNVLFPHSLYCFPDYEPNDNEHHGRRPDSPHVCWLWKTFTFMHLIYKVAYFKYFRTSLPLNLRLNAVLKVTTAGVQTQGNHV